MFTKRFFKTNAFYDNDVLERFASHDYKLVTMRQLTVFGRRLTQEKLLKSANYLRTELPVRLAHRLIDFQQLPFIVGTNPHIQYLYQLYTDAFDTFRKFPKISSLEDNDELCRLIRKTLKAHLTAIPQLSLGMSQCFQFMGEKDADRFMTETLRSRIGRRVLAEQHLALSDSWEAHQCDHDLGRFIGIIDTKCNALKTTQKCAAKASAYIQETYDVVAPQVIINGRVNATFLYIPDHIEYILYELIQNSMEATIQKHSSDCTPPVTVTIGKGFSSIIFRISDQGGGINEELISTIFSLPDGARRESESLKRMRKINSKVSEPAASGLPLGLSLAMSKLYTNYWGGDITLYSMDGFGTDVYVNLAIGNQLENLKFNGCDAAK